MPYINEETKIPKIPNPSNVNPKGLLPQMVSLYVKKQSRCPICGRFIWTTEHITENPHYVHIECKDRKVWIES